MNTVVLIVTK